MAAAKEWQMTCPREPEPGIAIVGFVVFMVIMVMLIQVIHDKRVEKCVEAGGSYALCQSIIPYVR